MLLNIWGGHYDDVKKHGKNLVNIGNVQEKPKNIPKAFIYKQRFLPKITGKLENKNTFAHKNTKKKA